MRVLLGCIFKSCLKCLLEVKGEMSVDVAADDAVNHTSGFLHETALTPVPHSLCLEICDVNILC